MELASISRRRLAGLICGGLGVAALSACAGKTEDQLHNDVVLISQGLSSIATALAGIPGIPAGTLAQIQVAIAQVQANAAQIAATLTPGQSLVQQLASAVQTVSNLASPYLPTAPQIAAVVQAAIALLPIVLAAAKAPVPAGISNQVRETPEDARLVLRSATAR